MYMYYKRLIMSNLESGIFYLLLSLKDLKELGKKGQEDSWKNGRLGRGNTTSIQQWVRPFNFVHRGYSRVASALLPFRDMCKNVPLALCTNICSRNFLSPAKLGEIHHSRNLSSRRAKTDVVRIVR